MDESTMKYVDSALEFFFTGDGDLNVVNIIAEVVEQLKIMDRSINNLTLTIDHYGRQWEAERRADS